MSDGLDGLRGAGYGAALNYFKTGNMPEPVTKQEDSPVNTTEESSESSVAENDFNAKGFIEQIEDPLEDEASEQSEDSEQENQEASTTDSEDSEEDSDIREVLVTGADGKRKKLKIDFSDKDKLERQVKLAYGARKWQKERDDARSQASELKGENEQLKADFSKLEKAYGNGGLEGFKRLVEQLEGEGSFGKLLKEAREQEELLEAMSPEERSRLETEKRTERLRAEKEQAERDREALKRENEEALEEMRLESYSARIEPSFARYRFAGKLGDPVAEHRVDKAIWSDAIEELDELKESGVELSQALIDKAFRKANREWKKALTIQGDKQAKKTIDKTKKQSLSKAQATVSKSMQTNQDVQALKEGLKKGDAQSVFRSLMKSGKSIF